MAFDFSALVVSVSCQSSEDDRADSVICQKIPNQLQSLAALRSLRRTFSGDLSRAPLKGKEGGASKSIEEGVGESQGLQPEMAMCTPQGSI